MVPRWLPGPKKEPFRVTLGCLLEVFWEVFWMICLYKCKVFVQDCGDFRSYFLKKDCRYFLFTCLLRTLYLFILTL